MLVLPQPKVMKTQIPHLHRKYLHVQPIKYLGEEKKGN